MLSTAWNTQRFMELHRKEKREKEIEVTTRRRETDKEDRPI